MKLTKEKIQEWKELHGNFFQLTTEDGKQAFIFDPMSDLLIAKAIFSALEKSSFDFVEAVLVNCWLGGDEIIRQDEAYVNELASQLEEFVELPECTLISKAEKTILIVESISIEVRTAMRADIKAAQKRNYQREPFETNAHLLRAVAVDKEAVDKLRAEKPKLYLAFLAGVEKIKNKKVVEVKKY